MWYSNSMQFPFQELYKEYAQNQSKKHQLRRFSMQHQNMVWQNIRRWSSRIRTWVYGSIRRNLRLEAEDAEDMVSCSEALQGQKTRRCFAPSCLTLMIFKRCMHKHQIRSKYRWQATLTDKRNVRSY